MLTRLNFTRNSYVSLFAFCTVAFVLLNAPVFAMDTPSNGTMTVMSLQEMELLAGGSYREPNWVDASSTSCGSLCGFCSPDMYYIFRTCFCNGPTIVPYCAEKASGHGWSRYSCGCALWSCDTKFFMGTGGTRYRCET